MPDVPYYTTDDESQWCGHIWQQRMFISGPWGYMWEVTPPFGDEPVASGWRATQHAAEFAMQEFLKDKNVNDLPEMRL